MGEVDPRNGSGSGGVGQRGSVTPTRLARVEPGGATLPVSGGGT